jgi:hypothetical protein
MRQSAPSTLSLLRMHRCRIRFDPIDSVGDRWGEESERACGRNDRRGGLWQHRQRQRQGKCLVGGVALECRVQLQGRQRAGQDRTGLVAGRHGHWRCGREGGVACPGGGVGIRPFRDVLDACALPTRLQGLDNATHTIKTTTTTSTTTTECSPC